MDSQLILIPAAGFRRDKLRGNNNEERIFSPLLSALSHIPWVWLFHYNPNSPSAKYFQHLSPRAPIKVQKKSKAVGHALTRFESAGLP